MSPSLEIACPRDLKANLLWRIRMMQECENDMAFRSAVMEVASRDIHFFFDGFLFTYDDRTQLKHLPFILKDYQREYVSWLDSHIENQVDGLTEKSRDMGATEIVLSVMLHRWLFKGDGFLVGSRTEELVDKRGDPNTHFERLRYKLYQLPGWMLPERYIRRIHDGYMKLNNPSRGNAIIGQAMTRDFGRQGRYRAVFLDEFAFIEQSREAWTASGDSTRCRLPVSTVGHGGRTDFFGWLRHETVIDHFTLHYSNDPDKGAVWQEREKARKRPEEWAREQDINYDIGGANRKVIKPEWIRQCRAVTTNLGPNIRVVSCDPARFGDDKTVIMVLEGYHVIHKQILEHQDTMRTVGDIKAMRERFGAKANVVECVGIGAGVVDRLTEQGEPVIPINPGEQASNPAKFINMRAEMWWMASELFRDVLVGHGNDPELERQLEAPQYEIMDSGGKIKIEPKDNIKKLLGRSPDDADALVQGLWAVRALSAYITAEELAGNTDDMVTGDDIGVTTRVNIGPDY